MSRAAPAAGSMRALAVALVCGLAVACGGSATAPDAVALPLRAGLQLLTLSGFAASVNAEFPACTPVGVPRDGTSVATVVTMTSEGQEWVARSSAAMGDVELRFRGTGITSAAYTVTGTMRGTGRDAGLNGVVRDVSVTLGAASGAGGAVVDGATVSLTSSMIVGRASGTLRFTDSQGSSSACSAIQWTLQPY